MKGAVLPKTDIARRFSRAAAAYDAASIIQRLSGARLAAGASAGRLDGRLLLDIGSGSGQWSAHWQQQGARVCALDIAEGMLHHSRAEGRGTVWLGGDAQALPLADASVDVCFSNLALQWCDDWAAAWREIHRVLKPGGAAWVSTLADGSMQPLRRAWAAVDGGNHSHHFAAEADLQAVVAALAWAEFRSRADTETLWFADLNSLLQSLRQVGANHVGGRRHGLTGRRRWQAFAAAYAAYRAADGRLPLDYRLVYWWVQKAA